MKEKNEWLKTTKLDRDNTKEGAEIFLFLSSNKILSEQVNFFP